MRFSAEQVPSLHSGAARYLELVTPSNFWPFMLISALVSVVLLVMTLLFSVLTSSTDSVNSFRKQPDTIQKSEEIIYNPSCCH